MTQASHKAASPMDTANAGTPQEAPLRCPRCSWIVAISEVDPPASADDFVQHMRWLHGMSLHASLEALAHA